MKIVCPACAQEIPPDGVNVAKGVAYCAACQEGFELEDLVDDEALPVERPANAQSILSRDEDRLALALPRGGFKGVGCFFTFFALFWNSITWMFVFMAIGSMLGFVQAPKKNAPDIFMLLFMIPFIAVGIGTGLAALYCVFGEVTLAMDRTELLFRRQIFSWKWEKTFEVAKISDIRITEAYKQNNRPVYGVGIHIDGKSMPVTFGSGLNEDEKRWLVYELWDFCRRQKKKSA